MTRLLALALLLVQIAVAGEEPPRFRPGGPLAGLAAFVLQDQKTPLYPGAVEVFSCLKGGKHPLFDRQTLRVLWQAPELPTRPARKLETFQPGSEFAFRGKGPFPVVRCRVGETVLPLECGELAQTCKSHEDDACQRSVKPQNHSQ